MNFLEIAETILSVLMITVVYIHLHLKLYIFLLQFPKIHEFMYGKPKTTKDILNEAKDDWEDYKNKVMEVFVTIWRS